MSVTLADPNLVQLHILVQQCANVAGTLDRTVQFKEHGATIQPLLAQIYDPFQKFHVTAAQVLKHEKKKTKGPCGTKATPAAAPSLSALLTRLSNGSLSGHAALDACVAFLRAQPLYRETVLKALNKDLKIRVGAKLVNKAFPGLVPEFSCALSFPLEKHEKMFQASDQSLWSVSRKLDGCRCLFICEAGQVVTMSRSGHVYPAHIEGLNVFLERFRDLNAVLDGEMVVVDAEGKEYFNVANSLMNTNATKERSKKNLQLQPGQKLCFYVFDYIPLDTFKRGQGPPVWSDRQRLLKSEVTFDDFVRLLSQHPYAEMETLWQAAEEKGWEGLMLRKDVDYVGKKSNTMLKRKRQDDEEFQIVEASSSQQMGPGSTDSVTALEHVAILYKGDKVWVGSGWTWEDRVGWGKNPTALVGRTITVKHYGETRDREGHFSLRHPSVKCMWDPSGRTT
jgi:DNA ligase-1